MARKLRRIGPDMFDHVWNRGHRKTHVYLDDQDRFVFLKLIRDLFPEHGITVHAYCLVGNHYHLLIYDAEGRLSEAMHDVAGSYARYFNDRYKLVGSVFQGRFESRPISDDADLTVVSRYVHRNALDMHPNAPIDRYRWSSYPAYVFGSTKEVPVDTSTILGIFGSRDAYRRFVESPHPSDLKGLLPSTWAVQPMELESTDHLLTKIECAVKEWFGAENVVLDASSHGRVNDPRAVAVVLGAEIEAISKAELAIRYGYGGPSQLRSALCKSQKRLVTDAPFRFAIDAIRQAARRSGPTAA